MHKNLGDKHLEDFVSVDSREETFQKSQCIIILLKTMPHVTNKEMKNTNPLTSHHLPVLLKQFICASNISVDGEFVLKL